MDRFISNNLVDFSFPFKSDDFVSGHIIEPRERSDSSSLWKLFDVLAPSISFFVGFLFANLFYFASVFLLVLAVRKCLNLGNRTRVERKLLEKFTLTHSVLLILFILITFFETQFISNNISTQKVIVDVSQLLHSEDAIRTTKRKPCFIGSNG